MWKEAVMLHFKVYPSIFFKGVGKQRNRLGDLWCPDLNKRSWDYEAEILTSDLLADMSS
jgi:hypothetical protein